MKRAHSKSLARKEKEVEQWNGPILPLDLWFEVSSHMRLENVSEIFQWMLIGKIAIRALPYALKYWAARLRFYSLGLPNETFKQYRILVTFLQKQKVKDAVMETFLEEQSKVPLGTPQFELVALFELQKQALIDRNMFRSKYDSERYGVKVGGDVVQPVKVNVVGKIGHVYYYNEKKQTVVPMKRLPGLLTVEAPNRKKLPEEALAIVTQRQTSGSVFDELALKGIEKVPPTSPVMRSIHYELKKTTEKPLETHKPHKSSLLCNAVVNGRHLYSDHSDAVRLRSCLYTCFDNAKYFATVETHKVGGAGRTDYTANPPTFYPRCRPEFIILQYVTARARFLETWKKMKIEHGFRKGWGPSSLCDGESSSSTD